MAGWNTRRRNRAPQADMRATSAPRICRVAAMQGAQGTGQKVGGAGTSEPPAAGDDLRARMAAAAEARFKAQQGGAK